MLTRSANSNAPMSVRYGTFACENLPRLGGLLEAGGHVDGVARDERASFPCPPHDDFSRVDADA
jgi:hypothetical protein